MPLNRKQENDILASIEHLLDSLFPIDADDLKNFKASDIQNNIDAVFGEQAQNSQPTAIQLRNCLLNPGEYFFGLEKDNKNITIKDVQDRIIMLINTRITTIGTVLKFSPHIPDRKNLPAENKVFVSERARTDSGHTLYHINELDAAIFSATINFEPDFFHIPHENSNKSVIHTRVYISSNYETFVSALKIKDVGAGVSSPNFANTQAEDEFLNQLFRDRKEAATNIAREHAAKIALESLGLTIPQKRIDEDPSFRERVYVLITTKYYFDLVRNNTKQFKYLLKLAKSKSTAAEDIATAHERITIFTQGDTIQFLKTNPLQISLRKLCKCSNNEVFNLCFPSIADLIHGKSLTIEKAKKLSPSARNLACQSAFFNMLKLRKVHIEQIEPITAADNFFMSTPQVAGLIELEILSFDRAKAIPAHLRPVLQKMQFNALFKEKNFPWAIFFKLEVHHAQLLLDQQFGILFSEKKLDCVSLVKFSPATIRMLLRNPTMSRRLEKDPTLLTNLHEDNSVIFYYRYASAYMLRIVGLALEDPFSIDKKPNAKAELQKELLSAAQDCHSSYREFMRIVNFFLVREFCSDLSRYLKPINPFANEICTKFFFLYDAESRKDYPDWTAVMNGFANLARRINFLLAKSSSQTEESIEQVHGRLLFKICKTMALSHEIVNYTPSSSLSFESNLSLSA